MKHGITPTPMITSPYNTYSYPNTVLNIKDNTEKKIESRSTENYSMIFAGYMPLGVTNEIMCYEGAHALELFNKHSGNPNTLMYGPMGTYAQQAIASGFKTYFLNTRLPDATYPNFYVALDIKPKKGEDKDLTIYAWLNQEETEYNFALNKSDLPEGAATDSSGANIKEIKIPRIEIGFIPYNVQDAKHGDLGYKKKGSRGFVVEKYLRDEAFKDNFSTSEKPGIEQDEEFHLPLFGLFYRGAGSYGNVFKFNLSNAPVKIKEQYNEFVGEITNQNETEHKFNFALFDIDKNGLNMGFGDRASETCKIRFTLNNHTDTFRAYSLTRKQANKIGPAIDKLTKKVTATIIAKVKETYHEYNHETSTSDLQDIIDDLQRWSTIFAKPKLGTAETYLSKIDMLKDDDKSTGFKLVDFIPCPNQIQFGGGDDGALGEVINSGEFDWKQKVQYNDESILVWDKLLIDFWSGKLDDSLFDSKIIRDAIIIADGVSTKVQQVIDDLVFYREGVFNFEESRPDMLYIRTPDEDVTDMEGVYAWQRSFTNKKNMSVCPNVGRFRFTDPTTGAQVYLSGFFSYLGPNGQLYNYLSKGITDPFASGGWSYVNKAAVNSEELIPRGSDELTQLTNTDITFYQMQSDGIYKLGLDTCYNPGFESVGKNIGCKINENRIMNIAHNILFDNKIIKPTSVNLKSLEDTIKEAISPYTKFFNDMVSVKVKISEHPEEINKHIVLALVDIYADFFSTRNRCEVTLNDANSFAK